MSVELAGPKSRLKTAVAVALAVLIMGIAWFLWRNEFLFRGPVHHVRISVIPSYGNTLIFIAKEQGFFTDEGVGVDLVQVPNSSASVAAVADGKVDLGTSFEMQLLRAVLEGKPLVALTELYSSSSQTSVVYRIDRGIRRPEDLVGRKVGVLSGTNGEFVLDLLLSSRGISVSSVNEVDLPWDKHADAMLKGELDAVVSWEPTVTELVSNREVPMSLFTADFYTEINSLIARRENLGENKEMVGAVLKALKRAQEFFRENPTQAREIAARYVAPRTKYGMSLFWDKMNPHIGLSSVLLTMLSEEAEWMKRKHGMAADVNVKDMVTPVFLNGVLPESVTYE